MKTPFLIGISGGSGSGKTSVAREIEKKFGDGVQLLSQDHAYRDLTDEQLKLADRNEYNFDHPSAQDQTTFAQHLINIKKGETVSIVPYDHSIHRHNPVAEPIVISQCQVCIVEGIFLFIDTTLADLFDLKIFVDVDDDIRLCRRIERDTSQRGRSAQSVINDWRRFVKPGHDEFVFPSRKQADIIIPHGARNTKAIDMIISRMEKEIN